MSQQSPDNRCLSPDLPDLFCMRRQRGALCSIYYDFVARHHDHRFHICRQRFCQKVGLLTHPKHLEKCVHLGLKFVKIRPIFRQLSVLCNHIFHKVLRISQKMFCINIIILIIFYILLQIEVKLHSSFS